MSSPMISDYLKYANLQMAAEALYRYDATPRGTVLEPGAKFFGDIPFDVLTTGNLHTSKFANETEAKKFAEQWVVVEHISNTTTGFSGTLFQAVKDDPSQGIVKGQYVLSFRSTEFLDDAARDNTATNVLEIKEKGWAFGQISDMENWYQSLKSSRKIPEGAQFSVTGYSLGGHLATAFNLMHGNEMNGGEVITFNGAGVGKIGVADGTLGGTQQQLTRMIARFQALRSQGESTGFLDQLQSEAGRNAYVQLKAALAKTQGVPGDPLTGAFNSELEEIAQAVNPAMPEAPGAGAQLADYRLLTSAVSRIKEVFAYAHYAPNLNSGSTEGPANPANIQDLYTGTAGERLAIAAESLDYQIAVLTTATEFNTASLWLPGGVAAAFGSRSMGAGAGNGLANQWDLAGVETSDDAARYMVAHSQYRYGQAADLFIEDQPLYRGGAVGSFLDPSNLFGNYGIRLLFDGYVNKDFGDTHSLVLIVDSLAVQNTLVNLLPEEDRAKATDPNATLGKALQNILKDASWRKRENGDTFSGSGQGQAEGDALENVVNALSDLFLGAQPKAKLLNGSPDGNTWSKTDASFTGADGKTYTGRDAFYEKLKAITESEAYQALAGSLNLVRTADELGKAAPNDLVTRARTDFSVFAALYSLSPFMLKAEDSAMLEATAGLNWNDTYLDWMADKNSRLTSDPEHTDTVTDQWLTDRAALVTKKAWYNDQNKKPYEPNATEGSGDAVTALLADAVYEDRRSDYRIQQGQITRVCSQ